MKKRKKNVGYVSSFLNEKDKNHKKKNNHETENIHAAGSGAAE